MKLTTEEKRTLSAACTMAIGFTALGEHEETVAAWRELRKKLDHAIKMEATR